MISRPFGDNAGQMPPAYIRWGFTPSAFKKDELNCRKMRGIVCPCLISGNLARGAFADGFGDGPETLSVQRTGAESIQRRSMRGDTIALVGIEAIGGKLRVGRDHPFVPRGFGEDRGGRDRRDSPITPYFRACWNTKIGNEISIDHGQNHRARQCGDRTAHRKSGGAQDVEPVDLLDARKAQPPFGAFIYFVCEILPRGG